MNWKFVIKTGELFDPTGKYVWKGYAGGAGGARRDAVNNPLMVSVKGVGPLPPGIYTFGTPVPQSHLGPFAIPLIPDANNVMFGRSAFYCHGDRADVGLSASDGCIIMPRWVRAAMWASKCHTLEVVAEA